MRGMARSFTTPSDTSHKTNFGDLLTAALAEPQSIDQESEAGGMGGSRPLLETARTLEVLLARQKVLLWRR